jgi:hypothetical protein
MANRQAKDDGSREEGSLERVQGSAGEGSGFGVQGSGTTGRLVI